MKRFGFLVGLAFCFSVLITFGQDSKQVAKQEPVKEYSSVLPNPAFDKIKTLEGKWAGPGEGMPAKMSYKVMSAGSSVLLLMDGDKPGNEMVTVFHPDGQRLLATHYCSAKNQPRFVLVPGEDPNVLRFEFLDATNLANPKVGHMVGLTLRFLNANHHVQEWTFREDGKDQTGTFDLHRKM